MARRWPLSAPFLAVFAFAWSGCAPTEDKRKHDVVRPVKTMVIEPAALTLDRAYPGEVRPDQKVILAFEVAGQIIDLPVVRGEEVEKGQLLARLDPRDFENALEAAKAEENRAQVRYDRIEQAADKGAVSQQELTNAEAQLNVAKAQVKIKQKALDDTVIHAEFAGLVAEKFVENFQNITGKEPILDLQDITNLEVVVHVPERDFATAEEKNLGTFTVAFDAIAGRTFALELKEAATDADPVTQTYMVKFKMPQPGDANVYPGMTASVKWSVPMGGELGSPVMVPAAAVFNGRAGAPSVWVIDRHSMKVSARQVAIGTPTGDRMLIEQGLKDGEMIAVSGVHHLREGMKVRTMKQTPRGQTN